METKEITEKIIDGLRIAAVELEEFQLQFALGKADATDKFEEIKKKLNLELQDFNSKVTKGKEKIDSLKAKFEELQLQLELGKADTLVLFEEQKNKIKHAIQELEIEIKQSKISKEYIPILKDMLEKFKIKLDILYVKFEIEDKKNSFLKAVDGIKNKITKDEKTDWEHFSSEITEAYSHLKKAFNK